MTKLRVTNIETERKRVEDAVAAARARILQSTYTHNTSDTARLRQDLDAFAEAVESLRDFRAWHGWGGNE